jgi:hypothetical protein
MMALRSVFKKRTREPAPAGEEKPRCGLCGKTKKLTKTDCCGKWICDDEHTYVLFSYARNSCHRNHDRYTLCSFHFNEGHPGEWQSCKKCRKSFETEIYVWYGTNEYNFEKLKSPPSYKPTKCVKCRKVINLGTDGFSYSKSGYTCMTCASKDFGNLLR